MADDKQAQIEAGEQAKLLLENPLLIKAFSEIMNSGYHEWISTDMKDSEGREHLYHRQVAILQVKNKLVQIVENGKILKKEQEGVNNG